MPLYMSIVFSCVCTCWNVVVCVFEACFVVGGAENTHFYFIFLCECECTRLYVRMYICVWVGGGVVCGWGEELCGWGEELCVGMCS